MLAEDGGSGFFLVARFHVIGLGNTITLQDYTSNDTSHVGYESGRGFPIVLERVGGGTFSLFSLDAAEFYAVAVLIVPTRRP